MKTWKIKEKNMRAKGRGAGAEKTKYPDKSNPHEIKKIYCSKIKSMWKFIHLRYIVSLKIKGQIKCNWHVYPHIQLEPLTWLKSFPPIKRKYTNWEILCKSEDKCFEKKSPKGRIFSQSRSFVIILNWFRTILLRPGLTNRYQSIIYL